MSDRRAAERIQIVAAVECSSGGQREIATAYDISADGCLVQTSLGLLAEGDRVSIRFGHGEAAEGRVVWTRNRNAGVQFDRPLSSTAVAAVVRRSAQWAREAEGELVPIGALAPGAALAPAAQLGYHLYYAFCAIVVATCAAMLLQR